MAGMAKPADWVSARIRGASSTKLRNGKVQRFPCQNPGVARGGSSAIRHSIPSYPSSSRFLTASAGVHSGNETVKTANFMTSRSQRLGEPVEVIQDPG